MPVLLEPLDLATLKRGRPVVFDKIDVTLTHNEVGSAVVEMPANARNWELIQLDVNGGLEPFGLVMTWNDVFVVPLLIEDWSFKRSLSDGRIVETLTLTGSDFLSLLANRIAFRDASLAWTAQTVGSTTFGPWAAETVIKTLVYVNLVTAGDTDRRVPLFTIATDQARGGTASYKVATPAPDAESGTENATVQQSLMDMVRAVDEQSPMGVEVTLGAGALVFDCYVPRDLSEKAVFSTELGNLPESTLTVSAPTGNAVLVQSKVAGATFTEAAGAGATSPWRRVEQFTDQSSTDTAADVTTATNEAVAAGAGTVAIEVTVVDLPRLRFGADGDGIQGYRVGDIVTLDLRDGVTYSDVVSKVQLVADSSGDTYTETVTPTIGTASGDSDRTISAKLAARLRAVEKALRGSVAP
ncbi:hypothetical protein BJF79_03605 [Actinomadura sp. CNU-125]|uniref:Gp37-like protein n=1 Tax=Actinomadura sp. CNU-125 TaxID=1904961 RepID=UPI000960C721|nr:hypothetical protein [Actinomadura sp. CNU-125]OLT12998.1 hypothetical protein BJF79_03605 [Actinomadura sp. CNU-125]